MIVDDLIEAMTEASGVTKEAMLSKSRKREVCAARNMIWVLLHRKHYWSYARIGRVFNRDHATVVQGIRRTDLYAKVPSYDEEKEICETFTRILTEKNLSV